MARVTKRRLDADAHKGLETMGYKKMGGNGLPHDSMSYGPRMIHDIRGPNWQKSRRRVHVRQRVRLPKAHYL